MWFNSKQREEPYLDLTSPALPLIEEVPSGTGRQVVHGCRQLVSWDVGLSPATSATLIASYYVKRTLARLPLTKRRKVGMTSNHHALYDLGYTRTTMALNKEKQDREVEQNSKTTSQFRLQAATRLHEVGIASNRGSACRGEYVPGPCTHRPSHHESRGDPKSVV